MCLCAYVILSFVSGKNIYYMHSNILIKNYGTLEELHLPEVKENWFDQN